MPMKCTQVRITPIETIFVPRELRYEGKKKLNDMAVVIYRKNAIDKKTTRAFPNARRSGSPVGISVLGSPPCCPLSQPSSSLLSHFALVGLSCKSQKPTTPIRHTGAASATKSICHERNPPSSSKVRI